MAAAPTKPPDIKIGDVVLDRYKIVEQIGTGGHSVVFRGEDARLSRPVCVKVFSGFGGASGVGRTSYEHFVQEAFALSRLTHPNTLRIYDFGHLGSKEATGMPLQVCEYMNGGTLSNIIREQGKIPLDETIKIIAAMCAALSEAHALGIVHRDIKPQNILFGSVGGNRLPKLADFGIAKWTDDEPAQRANRADDTAIVAGQKLAMYSPSWAAPEQLAGQPVSPQTDIYSLACVAIYMISGKAIFADEDVYAGYKKRRTGEAHAREALVPLGTPAGIVDVLARAIAFDPKKRLGRIEELSDEMQNALEPGTEELHRLEETAPAAPRLPPAPPAPAPVVIAAPAPAAAPMAAAVGAEHTPAPTPIGVSMPTPTPITVAPSRWLQLSEFPQLVGDRRVHFAMTNEAADIAGPHSIKLRISLIPGPNGRVVHVKGLTCFVAPVGGRPSPAVQLERGADLSLVTARAQEIAQLRVAEGNAGAGHVAFTLGSEVVAVAADDCADPILFDFGPGADAYFVYTRGRTVPKSGRRG
jgi:serine/threonine-protein kinase